MSHRLFRIVPSFKGNKPIYPGDKIQPSISYVVSDKQKAGAGLDEHVIIEIYVDDEQTLRMTKPMSEFVNKQVV